jgi:circadian clock protein KaiC
LHGGFPINTINVVMGAPGTGKTILAEQLVFANATANEPALIREGVINDEPGVYVGFQENPVQLGRIMSHFDWDPEGLLKNEKVELMYRSPVEMQLDSVASELLARVLHGGVKRVVIDAIGDLKKSSADAQRFSDFMYSLTQ